MKDLLEAIRAFRDERGDAILAALLGYKSGTVISQWINRGAVPFRERDKLRAVLGARKIVFTIEDGKPLSIKIEKRPESKQP